MSVDRRNSQETALIVHHITSFILREEKKVFGDVSNSFSATDGSADGTCVDFQDRRPDFQEAVATLEKGYKLLMQNPGLEMRKYSEDFAGVIDEAQFLEFAETLTIADIGGLNWGRIVALFTMSGLLTLQLVRRKQQDVVMNLQEWLTTFINKHLSSWIERQGGWVSQKLICISAIDHILKLHLQLRGCSLSYTSPSLVHRLHYFSCPPEKCLWSTAYFFCSSVPKCWRIVLF